MRIKTSGWHFVALATPLPPPPSWQFLYMGKIFVQAATDRGVDSITGVISLSNTIKCKKLKNLLPPNYDIYVKFAGESKTSWMGVGWKEEGSKKRALSLHQQRQVWGCKHLGKKLRPKPGQGCSNDCNICLYISTWLMWKLGWEFRWASSLPLPLPTETIFSQHWLTLLDTASLSTENWGSEC